MRKDMSLAGSSACGFFWMVLILSAPNIPAQQSVLAERQQAALAQDILADDEDGRRHRAVLVAERLGPERMSDEVRDALIRLFDQATAELGVAKAEGMVLNDVVNGEFYLQLARLVASLHDSRAIPALARIGDYAFSRTVARGLASFGEEALPAMLEVIDSPEVSDGAAFHIIATLSMMVEDGGTQNLSMSARQEIAQVARRNLGSQSSSILHRAMDISVALNEPDLVQAVEAIAYNPSVLTARGFTDSESNRIRQDALNALSKAAE